MKKDLSASEARVICMEADAVFELVTEYMLENAEELFDLPDMTAVEFQMKWNSELQLFICVATKRTDKKATDLLKKAEEIGATTETIFAEDRYVTFAIDSDTVH